MRRGSGNVSEPSKTNISAMSETSDIVGGVVCIVSHSMAMCPFLPAVGGLTLYPKCLGGATYLTLFPFTVEKRKGGGKCA